MANKGGRLKKKKYDDGQRELLDALWAAKGGPAAIAHLLDVSTQLPVNWRNRGGVPLVYCMQLAAKLKIPPWGLNYLRLKRFDAKNECPPWEVVVRSYGFSKTVVDKILRFTKPGSSKSSGVAQKIGV